MVSLSIVTSLYRSAPYLPEFCRRVRASAEKTWPDYEIILVDDGSPDDALQVAKKLQAEDPRIVVLELSRNFGHHKALMTGLAQAAGQHVFVLDCDLEEPPELLETFARAMHDSDSDVIYGYQPAREGSWFRTLSGDAFYRVFNLLSDVKIPRNALCARLMNRAYVDALLACSEREIAIAGLWAYVGFKQTGVMAEKRHKGSTTYDLARRVDLAVRSIVAFSHQPLVWIAYLGGAILMLASLYIAYLVFNTIRGNPPSGYTSLIVSVWFLGGLILFCLGIVAIYLSTIFLETKRRPLTIVRKVHRAGS